MGCGVAALAGFDCNYIVWLVRCLMIAVAIFVLIIVWRSSSHDHKLRNQTIAIAFLVSPFVWVNIVNWGQSDEIHAKHDEFTEFCYQNAYESIKRSAINIKSLVVSPSSNVKGAYGFEIFYGVGQPKDWAGIPVSTSMPGIEGDLKGAYELRYTYVPERRIFSGEVEWFHGVKQEIIDLENKQVIAERKNYLWGKNFNRADNCLSTDWYNGNDGFSERVLGPRYVDSQTGEKLHRRKPEQYVKARLAGIEDVDVEVNGYGKRETLPFGSFYDYDNRTIRLPDGQFHMTGNRHDEPIPIISTVKKDENYIFVMLPDGALTNWPIRKILFQYRTKTGEEVGKIFVQIPTGIDWDIGWGFEPGDVSITDTRIAFKLLGKKRRSGNITEVTAGGRYAKRYNFVADIELIPQ